jgi:inorganic pyrophosphatase
MMSMVDDEQEDAKIICIHIDDPAFNNYWHIKDLPEHRLRELKRFFQDYKALEDKSVRVQDFFGPERARRIITDSIKMYDDKFREKEAAEE